MAQRRCRKGKAKFRFNPPYDAGQPRPPYISGSRWALQAHVPPPPVGVGYKIPHRRGPDLLAKMRQEQLPQSVYCILNPFTGPKPQAAAPKLNIEVVEELRVHPAQGPQVVTCRAVGGDQHGCLGSSSIGNASQPMVAKIYDPLYYCYNGEFDVVELADREYSREAAAYMYLQRKGIDGRLLPAYYGSYTIDLPLSEEQTTLLDQYSRDWDTREGCNAKNGKGVRVRQVRIVLMEKVEGQAMTFALVFGDIDRIPDEIRLGAVASAMEAYARLYFHGVVHGDLAPRNVYLEEVEDDNGGDKQLRFGRFVDLGLAYVLGEATSTFPRQPASETRPRNPIRLFWRVFDSGGVNMFYWLPRNMRNTRGFHLWMLRTWYGDPRFEALGVVPQPSDDMTPWDTGQAAKDAEWPGKATAATAELAAEVAPEDAAETTVEAAAEVAVEATGRSSRGLGSMLARAMVKVPVFSSNARVVAVSSQPRAEESEKNRTEAKAPSATEKGGQPDFPKGFW